MFPGMSISLPSTIGHHHHHHSTPSSLSYRVYNIDDDESPGDNTDHDKTPYFSDITSCSPFDFGGGVVDHHYQQQQQQQQSNTLPHPIFSLAAAGTAHNRRMIIPYNYKRNPVKMKESPGLTMRDQPLVYYRFFEFQCTTCSQSWLSPLFRAKDGCFCRLCHQFILPRGIRHSLTPYLGKETCYGKYTCHVCARGWSSYKSLSNCPDQCFQCGTLVYPYYQIAHSVLYQKIHKNADPTKSAVLKSLHLTGLEPDLQRSDRHGESNDSRADGQDENLQEQQHPSRSQQQQQHPRKIISISGIAASTKQTLMINKKRLHCLNNVPFLKHTPQQVRRQIQLKPCFSEPIISP